MVVLFLRSTRLSVLLFALQTLASPILMHLVFVVSYRAYEVGEHIPQIERTRCVFPFGRYTRAVGTRYDITYAESMTPSVCLCHIEPTK